MPKRKYGNRMPYRQSLTTTLQDRIYTKRTYHVDAWVYDLDDVLYLVVITQAGGQYVLQTHMARLDRNGYYPVAYDKRIHDTGLQRKVNTGWCRKYAPWLRATLAKAVTHPRAVPPGFISPNSVWLHYYWHDARLNDPAHDIDNIYGSTARGQLYADKDDEDTKPLPFYARPVNPWTAEDRSKLRTLQKLLTPKPRDEAETGDIVQTPWGPKPKKYD